MGPVFIQRRPGRFFWGHARRSLWRGQSCLVASPFVATFRSIRRLPPGIVQVMIVISAGNRLFRRDVSDDGCGSDRVGCSQGGASHPGI